MQEISPALRFYQLRAESELVSQDICAVSLPVLHFLSQQFRMDNYHKAGHPSVAYTRGKMNADFHESATRSNLGQDRSQFGCLNLRATTFDLSALRDRFDGLPMDVEYDEIAWERLQVVTMPENLECPG